MLHALLHNIQAIAKNSKKAHITKEPFFDRQWGNNAAFKKTIDRADYTQETPDGTAEINEQILVLYKAKPQTKASEERGEFLNQMASDSMNFIKEQRTKMEKAHREETLCQASMAAMIEHVFEILKAYSYELNSALGYGPLHVAGTSPQPVTEVVKFNKLRQAEETVTYYRARLSTPSFSLVLRGDKKGIQFYLIPVERALGLSQTEKHFHTIAKLNTRLVGNHVFWELEDGKSLTPSMVEFTCMELFQKLIEETKIQVRQQNNASDEEDEFVAC